MMFPKRRFGVFLLAALASPSSAADDLIRIDSGVSGHIHPALAVTAKGTLIAVYCRSEYKPYLITRSTDGGKTWSKPAAFPHTTEDKIYPGSLTTLADGRIVHAWNLWFPVDEKTQSRHVAYSVSSDEGLTWSPPKKLAKNKDPGVESVIRHPFVELSPTEWLLSLMDRTVVYNPKTGEESPFGDGRNHGLVPFVRTVDGALLSGKGLRSTDGGKSWIAIKPFPDVSTQGWRHEMIGLKNGVVLASQIIGPGVGGEKIQFVLSRDGGRTWAVEHPMEFYDPGRPIGGRACPRTVEVNEQAIGTIFYDTDAGQPGGSGLFFRISAKPAIREPLVIDLWPGKPADDDAARIGAEHFRDLIVDDKPYRVDGKPTKWLTNVTKPQIHIYRPTKPNTGVAMLICPGGGYHNLGWDVEGTEIAEWLNDRGITGIILKYRCPRRPADEKGVPPIGPLKDAQRSVSLVRSRAREWGLDPNKIGMVGFSAGGHLVGATCTNFEKRAYEPIDEVDKISCRPDFGIMCYSGYFQVKDGLSPTVKTPRETPPLMFVHATDDAISDVEHSVAFYLALKRAKLDVAMHLYATGGHGFGVRPGSPCHSWTGLAIEWLRTKAILK